jgi:hypothetical protein
VTAFWADVEDDGTPNAALDAAGQGVRAFNHRSFSPLAPGKRGWEYASDAYRALGELTYLAGGLPQAFRQITAGLEAQLDRGELGVDRGHALGETDPGPPVYALELALEDAAAAAQQMYTAIAAAQSAIAAVHNVGEQSG